MRERGEREGEGRNHLSLELLLDGGDAAVEADEPREVAQLAGRRAAAALVGREAHLVAHVRAQALRRYVERWRRGGEM